MAKISNVSSKPTDAAPQSQLVKAPTNEAEKKDGRGRVIRIRKPGLNDMFRLTRMLGDQSSNNVLMQMALTVSNVISIDGDPVKAPGTMREIEALNERLDWEGFTAARELLETFELATADPDAAKN